MDARRASNALKVLIDEHAQDPTLRVARHVGDFVEVERAAMRFLERTDAPRAALAALDAEQLGLHRVGRDHRRIERHERAAGARGGGVQRARGKLLARARCARDHYAGVGRRDAVDRLAELIDGDRGADDAACLPRPRFEVTHFSLEPRGFQRPLGHEDQAVCLERLLDEVVGARLDGLDGGFDVAMARDHHDRQIGMPGLDLVEHLQPVEARALQPDIEEDEVRPSRLDRSERLVRSTGRTGAVALVVQNARDEIADIRLVVDDENVGAHDCISATRGALTSTPSLLLLSAFAVSGRGGATSRRTRMRT